MNKKDDEADTIVEISTFNISDNSSLQVKGEIVLGNLSNHNNVRKNGPWRLISDVVKDEMVNNDHVVDMIDIFPSTLTRTDGIDESYFKIFKFKNSHETGSYILSREHELYEPDYGFILSTPLLDGVKCPSTIEKEIFNFIKVCI